MVVYKFNNEEQARRFYESEESQALSKLRNEVTEGFVVIMPQYDAL